MVRSLSTALWPLGMTTWPLTWRSGHTIMLKDCTVMLEDHTIILKGLLNVLVRLQPQRTTHKFKGYQVHSKVTSDMYIPELPTTCTSQGCQKHIHSRVTNIDWYALPRQRWWWGCSRCSHPSGRCWLFWLNSPLSHHMWGHHQWRHPRHCCYLQ